MIHQVSVSANDTKLWYVFFNRVLHKYAYENKKRAQYIFIDVVYRPAIHHHFMHAGTENLIVNGARLFFVESLGDKLIIA